MFATIMPYLKDPRIWLALTAIVAGIAALLGLKLDMALLTNVAVAVASFFGVLAMISANVKDTEAKRLQDKLGMEKKDGVLGDKTQATVAALVAEVPVEKKAEIKAEVDPPKVP